MVPWKIFPQAVESGDGMFRLPAGAPRIPLSFSLRASKPSKAVSEVTNG
jgi:hypothetical protein